MSLRPVAVIACVLLVGACAANKRESYVEAPVESLYNEATDALLANRYADAARLYEEVERQHPYSVWATKAQLMDAYAQYQRNRYDEAINSLTRFIELNPGNHSAPYAYYLKALSYYEQIADVERDQKITDQSMRALDEVIRRFPESVYARDARIKLDLTRDHLAGKEMEIGRYYLRQQQYAAAINRFKRVIDGYQTTTHVPEALHRLTEAYLALGVREEAQHSAAVLGHNFPGSQWYADSYALLEGEGLAPKDQEARRSWLGRAWGSVF